jgi:hypothetical protein
MQTDTRISKQRRVFDVSPRENGGRETKNRSLDQDNTETLGMIMDR